MQHSFCQKSHENGKRGEGKQGQTEVQIWEGGGFTKLKEGAEKQKIK